MKVILFGATGMVGQGVLRECLLDPEVHAVLAVGRTSTGVRHAKLEELTLPDLRDLPPFEGYDACFFCLGVSSAGMSEPDYRRVTHDLTLAIATPIATGNPELTFVYVSGQGTGTSGRAMWARVKGQTEDALLALPFRAYMFRPGFIQPLHGITSKTKVYRIAYVASAPLLPVIRRLFPARITTTEQLGRAMIKIARYGWRRPILETSDINAVAKL